MAEQMKFNSRDSMNYLEPDDEDVVSDAQQLMNGALTIENYQPIRELDRIKSDSDRILEMTHFSTPKEKRMAENLQRNRNAWIDTGRDVLSAAINVTGLVRTCGPAIKTGVLTPADVTRATEHMISLHETLKRIRNRACDMAVDNSFELLLAIDSDEIASQNSTIAAAAEGHRNDLKKFQQGEVNVNVPYQSYGQLRRSLEQVEQNSESSVRQTAERSSRAWEMAKYLGSILLATGVIIGFGVLRNVD